MQPTDAPPRGDEPALVAVRPMEAGDLDFAAQLHAQALGHGLFPALGEGFLRRYLATYRSSAHAVAFVAEDRGAPLGFIVGTLDPAAHRQEVLGRHGTGLAVAGALGLVRRPRVAAWFLRTRAVRYASGLLRVARRRTPAAPGGAPGGPVAVLNHVAVSPEARGRDVGTLLVDAFLGAVRGAGVPAARLVTLAGGEGAGPFYRRLGWQEAGGYVDRDGVAWDRYEVSVP